MHKGLAHILGTHINYIVIQTKRTAHKNHKAKLKLALNNWVNHLQIKILGENADGDDGNNEDEAAKNDEQNHPGRSEHTGIFDMVVKSQDDLRWFHNFKTVNLFPVFVFNTHFVPENKVIS